MIYRPQCELDQIEAIARFLTGVIVVVALVDLGILAAMAF